MDAVPATKIGQPRVIVDSHHLSTLIASYNHHFAEYSNGRVKVTQIIPSVVWKLVYTDYNEVVPGLRVVREIPERSDARNSDAARHRHFQ